MPEDYSTLTWNEYEFKTEYEAITDSLTAFSTMIEISKNKKIEIPISWFKAIKELNDRMFNLIYNSSPEVIEKLTGVIIKID